MINYVFSIWELEKISSKNHQLQTPWFDYISNFGGVFAKTKQPSFWDHNFSGATLRPGLKAFDIWMAFEEGLGFSFQSWKNMKKNKR